MIQILNIAAHVFIGAFITFGVFFALSGICDD